MIKYILLGFLNYQPLSGYDLKQTLDSSTAHFWHAYHSQIYTTLRQMEKEGLLTSQVVEADNPLNKRVYTITPAGKAELSAWLALPLAGASPVKEELLVRLFFSAQREPEKVVAELVQQRQYHQDILENYRRLCDTLPHPHPSIERDRIFWGMTLEMGIRFEKMYLEWIEDMIALIRAS